MQIDHTQKISEIVIGLSKMVRTDVLMTSVVCDEYGNADPNGCVKDEYGDRGNPFQHVCGSLIGFNVCTPINEDADELEQGVSIELYFEGIKDIWRVESTPKFPKQFKIVQLSNGTKF